MYRENMDTSVLVRRHASLVKRIALHLRARLPDHVALDDLYQAGMVGLLEAARNFDGSKGASFETYAGIRIRGAILDEIRRGDWAPRSVHRNARKIAQAIAHIEQQTGADARDEQIAQELGVDLDTYYKMLKDINGVRVLAMEEAGLDEENSGFPARNGDTPFDQVKKSQFRQQLIQGIDQLPERERLVLSLYYEQEMNLKEIGLILGVSESRVCQIHGQAMARLRARLKDWVE
jgi:RNA polymerase sigma factor for flagellar operon FliA